MAELCFNDERLPVLFRTKIRVAENGCWEWTGSKRRRGYGRYGGGNKARAAHRISYEALIGPIPDDLELDHLCRCTSCVNPAHLEPVTTVENIRRARAVRPASEFCKAGHALTPENTYSYPNGKRRCRKCRRRHQDEHAARKAAISCLSSNDAKRSGSHD